MNGAKKMLRRGPSSSLSIRPWDPGKIPPEGYWRVHRALWEWLQILGVKDIDAAEKKVRKKGPFNQWKETAWHLWRKGEI